MAFNKPQNHVRIDVYAPRHKNGTYTAHWKFWLISVRFRVKFKKIQDVEELSLDSIKISGKISKVLVNKTQS